MKFGFVLPLGDAKTAVELATLAEEHGWDGFFVWEPVWGIDAWVSLAAVSMKTKKVRLGTLISPISRMRPWKLASEIATLDNLSDGRVTLSVGLGATDTGWKEFGEITDRKTRSELLDESLDIIQGLLKGQPFKYNGKHYTIDEYGHYPPPPPVQKPSVPIWIVGAWNYPKSMNRVLKCNGIIPAILDKDKKFQSLTKEHVAEIREFLNNASNNGKNYDIIIESHAIEDERVNNLSLRGKVYEEWEECGGTWWIEGMWDLMDNKKMIEKLVKRIKNGP
ncbi:MAG: LLM class flavin-dependent oxidoreductase [Candidatus Thorarchaeota archaeon]